MGIKGLIRDSIMFYIGFQLIFGGMEKVTAGTILIITSIIFTIIAYIIAFGSG
jgi:hypothetical protein